MDNARREDQHIPNGGMKNAAAAAATLEHNSLELSFLHKRLQSFQSTIVRDFEKRIDEQIEEVIQEIRKHELQLHEFKNFAKPHHSHSSTWNNRTITTAAANKSKAETNILTTADTDQPMATATEVPADRCRRRTLPDKVFVMRESYLTALLEVDHMKTIYHIFYIIFFALFMNTMCYDYFTEGRANFGLGTFRAGLYRIDYVFVIWLLEHGFVFTLYYAFKGWALVRAKLTRQAPLQRFWSHSCLIAYIAAQLLVGYVASALCLKFNLTFITGSILLLETTRLLMKMHAFVRFNAARVIAGKLKTDDAVTDSATDSEQLKENTLIYPIRMPTFGTYLYFLFAPTLIYRDHYPRTAQIRWKFALARFLEVVAIAFVYSYIYERHIMVHFYDYGRETINANALMIKFFGMLMPSTIILLSGFYLILHSWLNFTAELLRFGDRMFYKDWWTSSTYEAYYRNWNVVVHDWLYEYIYKDFYNHICRGSKVAASLMVFFTSALVHEHVLGFALQLFFPIMFVCFGGLGVSLVFLTRKAPKSLGNVILWATLIFGNGTMVSLYSMEYYTRINCPKTYATWSDYLTPAIWSCHRS